MSDKQQGRWRQTHCFVPGCRTGYKPKKNENITDKITLFRIPKNAEQKARWELAIPRQDAKLSENSAVCELHFDPQYVIRHWTHIIDGKEITVERVIPILKENAIPTIFPNLPKYFTK